MAGELKIPSIGVSAAIELLGAARDGSLDAPKRPMDVALYKGGPSPGDPGDAVIGGHLNWYGLPHAVFWNLNGLKVGDEVIVVKANGKVARFKVDSLQTYDSNAQPPGLLAPSGPSRLTLYTCGGKYDAAHQNYSLRLVVTSKLIA